MSESDLPLRRLALETSAAQAGSGASLTVPSISGGGAGAVGIGSAAGTLGQETLLDAFVALYEELAAAPQLRRERSIADFLAMCMLPSLMADCCCW